MGKNNTGCRGCLIWMAGLFAGLILVIGVTFYAGYLQLVSLRDKFTQPHPLELPVVHYAPGELDLIKKRIDQFRADARGDETNVRLTLSEREINGLLASAGYDKVAFVTITNGSIHGRVTIPVELLAGFLNRLGIALLRGRYMNGEALFNVSVSDGEPVVRLGQLTVSGQPLPEHYMERIRQINLLQALGTNAPSQSAVHRLQGVLIDGNCVVLELGPDSVLK